MADPRKEHSEVHAPLPVQQQEFPGEVNSIEADRITAIPTLQVNDLMLECFVVTARMHIQTAPCACQRAACKVHSLQLCNY